MVTTRIDIDGYLAEWLRAKWWDAAVGAVRFPCHSDVYELVYDLLQVRPRDVSPLDCGNLTLALPDRREGNYAWGKRPERHNYISQAGARVLNNRLRTMFWAEVHEAFDENKHIHGIDYKDTAYQLVARYSLTLISDDGLLKNYQRWRDRLRRKGKRGYIQAKKR